MNNENVSINLNIPLQDDDYETSYMERSHHVDLAFGIAPVALLIAQEVNKRIREVMPSHKARLSETNEEYDAYNFRTRTFPFYNVRENGIGLEIIPEYVFSTENLVICWAENRNSDDTVVYTTSVERNMNPPTLKQLGETESFWNGNYFAYGNIKGVVDYILETIEKYSVATTLLIPSKKLS